LDSLTKNGLEVPPQNIEAETDLQLRASTDSLLVPEGMARLATALKWQMSYAR
jgi:hypothetical protein